MNSLHWTVYRYVIYVGNSPPKEEGRSLLPNCDNLLILEHSLTFQLLHQSAKNIVHLLITYTGCYAVVLEDTNYDLMTDSQEM